MNKTIELFDGESLFIVTTVGGLAFNTLDSILLLLTGSLVRGDKTGAGGFSSFIFVSSIIDDSFLFYLKK